MGTRWDICVTFLEKKQAADPEPRGGRFHHIQ